MFSVHGRFASGNCYKVPRLLEQLGMPYPSRKLDVVGGATPRWFALPSR